MRTFFFLIISVITLSLSAQDKLKNLRPTSYNYQRGVEAIQSENTKEALENLNKEISDNPKNGYAYSWLAMLQCHLEEYGRALTSANNSLKYLPKKDVEYLYFAYENRAKVYAQLGDTLNAISDYTMAIKVDPDKDDAYEKRAQIYYELNKFDLADADYRKLISLDQGGVMGYMGIGRNRNSQKLWDEAIAQFDYVAKLYSDYSSVFGFRAESYIGKKDWDKATDDIMSALKIDSRNKAFSLMCKLTDEPAFSKMKAKLQIQSAKDPNGAEWPYYLGVLHEEKKLGRQAIRYYEEAQKRDASAVFLERIANCYDDEGMYEQCLEALENALNMNPNDRDVLSLKANTLYELGRFNEAIEAWDSILVKFPDYAWGYYRRGWFKQGIGDDEGAIEDFNMSSTIDPDYVYNYESRGNIYLRQGKKELSMADFNKLMELENEPSKYETVMYVYQTLGQNDKAIEVMDSIIARDTTHVGNYYDAACLYSRMMDSEKALWYLEKCLSMGYKRFSHIAIDHDMDNIRESPEFKSMIQRYKEKLAKEIESESKGSSITIPAESTVTEVSFTKEPGNSLCNVKCSINELPLYFIFDTGASDVSLSQVEATFMMKNGYLNKTDVVGKEYFSDAVGNVNVGTVINLRKVNFGGLELTNVKASVVQNQKAPLLLGQSILGRLGKIEIDNNERVLRITK